MNSDFAYFYDNKEKTLDLKSLFIGETILYKSEDIKTEDAIGNVERNMICFITNFRIICMNATKVFDMPLSHIQSHYIKEPLVYGSKYICVYLERNKLSCPNYIIEQLSQSNYKFRYPEYTMIKYKDKSIDIYKGAEVLKLAIQTRDYERSFLKKKQVDSKNTDGNNTNNTGLNSMTNSVGNTIVNNLSNTISSNLSNTGSLSQTHHNVNNHEELSNVFGIKKHVNMMENKIKENQSLISGSFLGISSLRDNAARLLEVGEHLKAKLDKTENAQQYNEINQILQKIGYIDPVTKEQSGKQYYRELAIQIQTFFEEYFKKYIGILTLIDAYCIYNRARGMNSISPEDMKKGVDNLKLVSNTIFCKTFVNNMILIYNNNYSVETINALLSNFFKVRSQNNKKIIALTLKEVCTLIKLDYVLMGKILVDELVMEGLLCVDEGDLEIKYYQNLILNKE